MEEYIDSFKTAERDVSTSNVGDLISRQAVLKELPHALWGKEWDEALARAIIESVPAVDLVKHGKWIHDDFGWHCSECHSLAAAPDYRPTDYCGWCGARMDGE